MNEPYSKELRNKILLGSGGMMALATTRHCYGGNICTCCGTLVGDWDTPNQNEYLKQPASKGERYETPKFMNRFIVTRLKEMEPPEPLDDTSFFLVRDKGQQVFIEWRDK